MCQNEKNRQIILQQSVKLKIAFEKEQKSEYNDKWPKEKVKEILKLFCELFKILKAAEQVLKATDLIKNLVEKAARLLKEIAEKISDYF